jgi:uncharacterized protein YbjQ (UPF0145 family)
MVITTMNDLPGYQIDEVLGEVFGLTLRLRHRGQSEADLTRPRFMGMGL